MLQQFIDTLQEVVDCEYDRDEESRNFDESRLQSYQALIREGRIKLKASLLERKKSHGSGS